MCTRLIWKVRATFFAAILAAGSTSAVYAQALGPSIKVNVPIAFASGTKYYPAGTYTFRMVGQHAALIRGDSLSGMALTQRVQDSQPSRTGKAVFRKYDRQFFLEEVWMPGMTSHVNYVKSKLQKKTEPLSNVSFPAEMELALLGTSN